MTVEPVEGRSDLLTVRMTAGEREVILRALQWFGYQTDADSPELMGARALCRSIREELEV